MRTSIFAHTETTSEPGHTVAYMSLNQEEDGSFSLAVRSGGRTGWCPSCSAQEPHSAKIDLTEKQLDDLAAAIQNRHLLSHIARLERRLSEVEGRTSGMVRLGGGAPIPGYYGGGVAMAEAAGGVWPLTFNQGMVQFVPAHEVPPGTITCGDIGTAG